MRDERYFTHFLRCSTFDIPIMTAVHDCILFILLIYGFYSVFWPIGIDLFTPRA